MKKAGKWHSRRAFSKLERLLALEKKCVANLVQIENSLLDCFQKMSEGYKSVNETDHISSIFKITNELSVSFKTHSQLTLKLDEVGARLNDILKSKEDNDRTEVEMMFFVLESGLRQCRTGALAMSRNTVELTQEVAHSVVNEMKIAEAKSATPSSSPSPVLPHGRRPMNGILLPGMHADDTVHQLTNNPFETASTSTDLRDEIDVDEEESLDGELQYEDLSVENYSNPFGTARRVEDSPSPPPLRVASANAGAERSGVGPMQTTPTFVSSEKCKADSERTPFLGDARDRGAFKKTTSSTPMKMNDSISTSTNTETLSSMHLPAVSPMASPMVVKQGRVFNGDEQRPKKKKKKDSTGEKLGKEKKKKKSKENKVAKTKGRSSPLMAMGEIRRQQNSISKGISTPSIDEISERSDRSEQTSSSMGTPGRMGGGGWEGSCGMAYSPANGACSSNEDLSDDEHSPTNERGTYHNPFGAPEPAESSPSLNGSVGFSPLPVKEEKDHKTFRGSVIDGMRGSKKKPSPKASPKASPRHNRGSSPQERLSVQNTSCSTFDDRTECSQMSMAEPAIPPFLSLEGLVDLALHGDSQYRQALILSFSHFSTAQEVMEILKKKFSEEANNSLAQQKVMVLLSYWMESSYHDLVHYEDSLFELIRAIQEQQERWGKSLFTKLSTKKILFSELGEGNQFSECSWDNLNEGDLALCITHSEARIFEKITPPELLAWNTKKKATHCATIHQAISFSTRLSGWITSEVVKRMKMRDRARLLEKFILLGEHLLEYRNFSGCMAVIGGLQSSAVWRMKKTWQRVDPDIYSVFEGLKKVMSHSSSYASYRAYLKGSNPPRIPFLGVSLSDLTFIDDGNKTTKDLESMGEEPHWEDLVPGTQQFNVSKCLMFSKVIADFQNSQNPKYSEVYPAPQCNFSEAIEPHRILSEEEAHQLSLFAEPKDPEEAMERALDLFMDAQKKVASLEKEMGTEEASISSPFMPYSPPLFRLPQTKPPLNSGGSEPRLKTSTLKRMTSSPLRPVTKRTLSQNLTQNVSKQEK